MCVLRLRRMRDPSLCLAFSNRTLRSLLVVLTELISLPVMVFLVTAEIKCVVLDMYRCAYAHTQTL